VGGGGLGGGRSSVRGVVVWGGGGGGGRVLMGTHLCVCVDLHMSAVRENKILGHSETHTNEQKYLGKLTGKVCVCG